MTVYIDDMYLYPMGQFGRMKMSHMVADTEDELHTMAARIGVARKWYQGDHYDISKAKRELAIRYGARAITLKQLAAYCQLLKAGVQISDPAHFEAAWRGIRAQRMLP